MIAFQIFVEVTAPLVNRTSSKSRVILLTEQTTTAWLELSH